MRARIVCLPGDGTGPEVMQEAVRVLTSVACAFDHSFSFVEEKTGRSALFAYGTPISEKTLESCRAANAVLMGPANLPVFDSIPTDESKRDNLSMLQSGLHLISGIQFSPLTQTSPHAHSLASDLNVALVWPVPNKIYEGYIEEDGQTAHEIISLTVPQAEQVMHTSFQLARQRRRSIHVVLEPGFLANSRIWRETSRHIGVDFPDVSLSFLDSNSCAAGLVRNPEQFDVLLAGAPLHSAYSGILAGRPFTSALSSCEMTGIDSPAVYLPAYADDPSLAGRDMISPIAMILTAAHMLRRSLKLNNEADCVEMAVKNVLVAGWRTADMVQGGEPKVGTQAIGKLIAEQVDTVGAVMGGFHR